MISIYSDGSSGSKGGKPGGYGWVIVQDVGTPEEKELAWGYGGSPATTNNLQEAEGAIQGMLKAIELQLHDGQHEIELVSDSQYTLGIASGTYKPNSNIEQAEKLRKVARELGCQFRWVKGHNGEKWNEAVDQLANIGKLEHMSPEQLAKIEAKKAKKARAKCAKL